MAVISSFLRLTGCSLFLFAYFSPGALGNIPLPARDNELEAQVHIGLGGKRPFSSLRKSTGYQRGPFPGPEQDGFSAANTQFHSTDDMVLDESGKPEGPSSAEARPQTVSPRVSAKSQLSGKLPVPDSVESGDLGHRNLFSNIGRPIDRGQLSLEVEPRGTVIGTSLHPSASKEMNWGQKLNKKIRSKRPLKEKQDKGLPAGKRPKKESAGMGLKKILAEIHSTKPNGEQYLHSESMNNGPIEDSRRRNKFTMVNQRKRTIGRKSDLPEECVLALGVPGAPEIAAAKVNQPAKGNFINGPTTGSRQKIQVKKPRHSDKIPSLFERFVEDRNGSIYIVHTNNDVVMMRKGAQDKFWATAAMLWEDVPGRVIDEAWESGKSFASAVEKAITSRSFPAYSEQHSYMFDGASTLVPLIRPLEEFSNALWCINSRILGFWGAGSGRKTYFEEQEAVQNWVLQILSADENRGTIECLDEGHHLGYISPKSTQIKESLLQYFLADETKVLFHVPSSNFEESAFEVSEKDILLIQAVKNILLHYYKTQNQGKWLKVFQADNSFLSKIAKLKFTKESTSTLDISIPSSNLMPWKSKTELISSKIRSLESELRRSMPLKRFQNDIKTPGGIGSKVLLPLQLGNMKSFHMAQKDADFWASITIIKYHQQDLEKEEEEFKTRLWEDQILPKLKSQLEMFPNQFESEKLIEEIEEFSNLIWQFNSRLLVFYGFESKQDYLLEQKAVQEYLLNVFERNNYWILNNQEGRTNSIPVENPEKLNKNLVIRSIISSKKYTVYISPKFFPNPNSPIEHVKISEKDCKMSEAALYLIGSYLKLSNPGKWKEVYQEDHKFLTMFSRIINAIYLRKSDESSEYKTLLRSMNLIPWKGELHEKTTQKEGIDLIIQLLSQADD
ncbi:hypothetical protein PGTUg99_022005 [Puccinia graminis f. sp. tritici]|uniref:Uncharacterized protein n=1 Tax=Puccinia graminis f. sp. tritici TaxID=56615 RepID=A0A5B0S9H0_PUCGR|nr:hypothetical protein PGTUg99_022005 [Puccinia graminis f. sp. tritici]